MVENPGLKRPAEIGRTEINHAERLVELSQQHPLPSLFSEPELLSALYYPLQQIPLPQFQFEMLVWESDKLHVFSKSESLKLSPPGGGSAAFQTHRVLYKRVDNFTVLAIVYSLESGNVAILTNEISETTWEIVGIFRVRDLAHCIDANSTELHPYQTFEEAYADARSTAEDGDTVKGNDTDDEYWAMYDKQLDSKNQKPAKPEPKPATEKDYWDMYDGVGADEDSDDQAQDISSGLAENNALALRLVANLALLYQDCGMENMSEITAEIRQLMDSRPISSHVTSNRNPQLAIANNHAVRTLAALDERFGTVAYKLLVHSALQDLDATTQR